MGGNYHPMHETMIPPAFMADGIPSDGARGKHRPQVV